MAVSSIIGIMIWSHRPRRSGVCVTMLGLSKPVVVEWIGRGRDLVIARGTGRVRRILMVIVIGGHCEKQRKSASGRMVERKI